MDQITFTEVQDFKPDEDVVAVTFELTIEGVIKSEFVSTMQLNLAYELAQKMLGGDAEKAADTSATPKASKNDTEVGRMASNAPKSMKGDGAAQPPPQTGAAPQAQTMPPPYPQQPYPQPYPQQMPYPQPQQPYPQQPYGYPMGGMPMTDPAMMGMGMGMGYGYPPYGGYPPPPINIQNAQLHQFENYGGELTPDQKGNLSLLMNVPLQVTVEIGSANRKVKDILEFAQGTIIELERQAGAPA